MGYLTMFSVSAFDLGRERVACTTICPLGAGLIVISIDKHSPQCDNDYECVEQSSLCVDRENRVRDR